LNLNNVNGGTSPLKYAINNLGYKHIEGNIVPVKLILRYAKKK